jgi:type I restriction enzyme M protein
MDTTQYNRLVSFIWNIADDVLRDVYVRGKYRDVILPMTVLRRLDALLTPTHEAVLQQKRELDGIGLKDQHDLLCGASGFDFYNTSPFTLAGVRASGVGNIRPDFEAWLDGFSPNVQEIITRFKFREQLRVLEEADRLMGLLERFLSPTINLSPKDVLDPQGRLIHPGLSNLGMGYVFEELLRRFSEENNEEAGEHFTPREVVRLMASLVVYPVRERNLSTTLTIYDCACGTGGMLTEAETMLKEIAETHGHTASVHLRGQEVSPETWAICQADLIIKGEAHAKVEYGSTLSADAFKRDRFDFMLANPPYGKSWKLDLEKLPAGNKHAGEKVNDPRFNVAHQGGTLSLVTRSSDGQLMFLVNMLAKMKPVDEAARAAGQVTGSRVATIHNGSSIMTGDAGQGESNIRRWVIENDWLEAVIALPENLFYNTGIATYVWVLSNDKAPKRRGKVQLIDATGRFEKLRRNLGKKNCQLSDADVRWVLDTYEACEDNEHSKVFPNAAFGYWQITVERPLRLQVDLGGDARRALAAALKGTKEEGLLPVVEAVSKTHGVGPHRDWNAFRQWVADAARKAGAKVSDKGWKALRTSLTTTNPEAEPVRAEKHGYEPDPELRDHENVPMTDTVKAYVAREVLPYVPDAWVHESATVIGYEIPFTRHFYKPAPMRSLEEIAGELRQLEKESEGVLARVLGGAE